MLRYEAGYFQGVTKTFLKKKGIEVVKHPLDGLVLTPCDFRLFPRVKHTLPGKKFNTDAESVRTALNHLKITV